MKSKILKLFLASFLAMALAGVASAQFDDIYFDPEDADEAYAAVELEKYYDDSKGESNAVEDDYEYYYSSRIKRFDRPVYGFDFYSPVYVDPFYYNPAFSGFYRPGSSIYWSGAYAAPVVSNVWVRSGFGWGRPAPFGVYNSFGPAFGVPFGGFYGGSGFYGGGFPTANGFYGASFGGVGGFGGGFVGGGYNAYCPPAVGSIYGNPTGGVFRPGNVGNVNTGSGSRGGAATSRPVYGPRGGAGSVTGSPRSINNRPGGTTTAPDRPLTTRSSSAQSPRNGQRTYTGSTNRSTREVTSGAPTRTSAYKPPAWLNNKNSSRSTRSSASSTRSTSSNRFSSTRPSRPSNYSRSSSSRSSWNSTRSSSSRSSFSSPRSSSSRSSFSSPRSSSSSRSSGASRSSGGRGGSPRGGR